jgi:hypothetical protein
MGIASAMARVAGIITPFVSNVLKEYAIWIPLVIYGSASLCAAGASLLLPIETKKQPMKDTVVETTKDLAYTKYGALNKSPL